MPRTSLRIGPDLILDIDELKCGYLPGDTLTGIVSWQPRRSTNDGAVKVKLVGRTYSETLGNNMGSLTHGGRAVFFDLTQDTFTGPMVADQRTDWTFSITIPTSPLPACTRWGDEWRQAPYFLSTVEDITKHPLPSSYYFSPATYNREVEGYVEYVLSAEAIDKQHKCTTYATLPLFLRSISTSQPITDYRFESRKFHQVIRSVKLLADDGDHHMSQREKARLFFHPSSRPKFAYSLRVDCPTVIQIDHPNPVPFKISMWPKLDPKNTTIDHSSLPPVKLVNLSLTLLAKTRLRAATVLGVRDPGESLGYIKQREYDFTFRRRFEAMTTPLVETPSDLQGTFPTPAEHNDISPMDTFLDMKYPEVPPPAYQSSAAVSDDKSISQSRPLDIGSYLGVQLHPLGSTAMGVTTPFPTELPLPLYPSFCTYNIALDYTLNYKITVECVGETGTIRGGANVELLGMSESQVQEDLRKMGPDANRKAWELWSRNLEGGVIGRKDL